MEDRVCHVVFVPVPGMGHLISMVELAKRILHVLNLHRQRLAITILVIPPRTPDPHLSSFLSASSQSHSSLSFIHLPYLQPPPSPPNTRPGIFIYSYLSLYTSSIFSALLSLHSPSSFSPVSAIVFDFFCSNLIDEVALKLNIPPYIFFTSSATMLAVMLLIPSIGHLVPDDCKAVELTTDHVIPFPGFSSSSGLPLPCLPDDYAHGKDELYDLFVSFGLHFRKAAGILVNTFSKLQPGMVRALEEGLYVKDHPTPNVYHVGPLLALPPGGEAKKHECIQWLDEQPRGTVVFLCFGSKGSFPEAQVQATAMGLERSGHAFLWVMRDEGLPEEFVERTKGRGLVWRTFAPQREILQHEAVGGFVTHCGWNSCLESLWFGVPMAAWPLYAEQHLNAFDMVEEMEVAVEVKIDRLGGNTATAEEVERAVKVLMGEESAGVREKVRKMKEEARKALEEEGDGSSYKALKEVVEVWIHDAASSQFKKN